MLLTQQQAWLHGLKHGAAGLSAQATTPHASAQDADSLCLQCLAFASMAHAASPQALASALLDLVGDAPHQAHHTDRPARTTLAYQSRAPPLQCA